MNEELAVKVKNSCIFLVLGGFSYGGHFEASMGDVDARDMPTSCDAYQGRTTPNSAPIGETVSP